MEIKTVYVAFSQTGNIQFCTISPDDAQRFSQWEGVKVVRFDAEETPSGPQPSETDISLMAHNIDPGDWNDLHLRDCWHKGFHEGFRAALEVTVRGKNIALVDSLTDSTLSVTTPDPPVTRSLENGLVVDKKVDGRAKEDIVRLVSNHADWSLASMQAAEHEPEIDDHQAFIETLSGDDRMFWQIDSWARQTYNRHKMQVKGNAVTSLDSLDTHIIYAAFRWAKEHGNPLADSLDRQPPTNRFHLA